ncbi:MAG: metal-sulfur cluster assembly factor [Micromonosporaceae bacterium]
MPWRPPDGCVYRDLLRKVIDPELGVNIVDLGLVYDVRVRDGTARVWMTLTTPGCPLGAYFDDEIRAALGGAPGVDDVDLRIVWEPPWRPEMMNDLARRQLGWSW